MKAEYNELLQNVENTLDFLLTDDKSKLSLDTQKVVDKLLSDVEQALAKLH